MITVDATTRRPAHRVDRRSGETMAAADRKRAASVMSMSIEGTQRAVRYAITRWERMPKPICQVVWTPCKDSSKDGNPCGSAPSVVASFDFTTVAHMRSLAADPDACHNLAPSRGR